MGKTASYKNNTLSVRRKFKVQVKTKSDDHNTALKLKRTNSEKRRKVHNTNIFFKTGKDYRVDKEGENKELF